MVPFAVCDCCARLHIQLPVQSVHSKFSDHGFSSNGPRNTLPVSLHDTTDTAKVKRSLKLHCVNLAFLPNGKFHYAVEHSYFVISV